MKFSIRDFFSKCDQICRKLCSVCCVNNTLLVLIMMITIYLVLTYTYFLNVSSDLTIDITYCPGSVLTDLRTSLQIYNLIIKWINRSKIVNQEMFHWFIYQFSLTFLKTLYSIMFQLLVLPLIIKLFVHNDVLK